MIRLIRAGVLVAVLAITNLALTACDTFPSGCVRIPHDEVPFPSWWDNTNRAVWWVHGSPATNTFVGVSAGSPWWDLTDTWHGPSQYNGGPNLAEYRSANRCFQTGGASSEP